jgi:YVTN family beta-propeller protein
VGRIAATFALGAAGLVVVSAPLVAQTSRQSSPLLTKGTAWATSRGPDTVTGFDAKSGRVVATIAVGKAPMGLAVPSGTNKLYVGNESSNSVSVISIPRREVVTTINIGSRPHHMHASKDGTRVYVAEFGTNKIAVIDTMTDTLAAEWATGPPTERTHAPAPTHDGKILYAVNSVGSKLAALDARTGAIQWSMPTGANPSELMVARDGRTGYLSVRNEDRIDVIDLEAHRVVREVPVGDQPDTLQLSPDGVFLVVALRATPAEVDVIDLKRAFAVTKVVLAARLAGHNWLSANGRYSFVSLDDPASVAVIDHRRQRVVATWLYPGGGSVHGMFYDDPRATKGPAVSASPRAAVQRNGRTRVRIACAAESAITCRGRMTLIDRHGTIGRGSFVLRAGSSLTVRLRLTARATAEVFQNHSVRAHAIVRATDALEHTRTVRSAIQLRPARR